MQLKEHTLPVGERTLIMGILNVTPDSFSDGGKFLRPDAAVDRACQMVADGADIIDVGGESSRPGACAVTLEEELCRVIPVIKALKERIDIPISVDTYKSEVAGKALRAGASIVNDITALRGDEKMASIVAGFDAGLILMHMKGDPKTMQTDPKYQDVIEEILTYLAGAVDRAVKAGVDPGKIILDPGIGFGKTLKNNLLIIKELTRFKQLGKPILVGTSHKSFIGAITEKEVDRRIFGTAASVTAAVMNGADIIRVHDIEAMRDVARVTDAIREI